MKDRDVVAGIALVVFSIIGVINSMKLPHLSATRMSAGFYPGLLFILLGICGIILIFEGWRRDTKVPISKFYWDKLIPIIVLFLVYAFLLGTLGFQISTIIFVFLFMFILGIRKIFTLIWVPLVSTFVIYYVFDKIFMIRLP